MSDDKPTDEQVQALSQAMGVFLDMMVQVIAVQFALVDAKLLTFEQINRHVKQLEMLPGTMKARGAYGGRSQVIDELLRSYEGPVQ